MVYFPGNKDQLNQYVSVRVLRTSKNSLIGEQVHE